MSDTAAYVIILGLLVVKGGPLLPVVELPLEDQVRRRQGGRVVASAGQREVDMQTFTGEAHAGALHATRIVVAVFESQVQEDALAVRSLPVRFPGGAPATIPVLQSIYHQGRARERAGSHLRPAHRAVRR